MERFYGRVPDYGAIFIANRNTRQECFDRKLFGAPSRSHHFVKQIKKGMVLFLFQYETRKLYGVFQAITDGKLNIVPEACERAGGPYPSQIRFSVIWRCTPLSEDEFRGAIKENYYAPYLFNFGLSKDQVQRLLSLFYPKNITVLKTLNVNKENRKHSKSLNEENHCKTGGKPTLEEGEVEISETGTPRHSAAASAASSFTGTLSFPLEKGSEHVIVSSGTPSSGLEDYIPLPSPDLDDVEEKVTTFIESLIKENQTKSAEGSCYEEPSLCEESIVPKVFGKKDLNQGLFSDGYIKSSPVHEKEKKEPVVKGLYADSNNERKSVFSRLNMVVSRPSAVEIKPASVEIKPVAIEIKPSAVEIKPAVVEIKDDLQSPDGLMKKLLKLHKKWKKIPKGYEKQNKYRFIRNRTSAFSRLGVALGEPYEKKRKTKPWDVPISKNEEMLPPEKKKRQSVFLRLENVPKESQVAMSKDPPRAKEPIKSEIPRCLVSNKAPSQENTTGNHKGERSEDPPRAKELINSEISSCLVINQTSSQENTAGKQKGESSEEGSTKSEIVQKNENVAELSPKPLLTYYRRRHRSFGSLFAKEPKLSVGVNGEDAKNQIVCLISQIEEGVHAIPV